MFGKKKNEAVAAVAQVDVYRLASEALRKSRASRNRLPLLITFASPILMQRWTTKAVRKMLGAMTGMKMPKEPKDLTKDFEDSWYRNEKGAPVVPCRIFKAAIVEGAISTSGVVTKADLKRSMRVLGYTTPLIGGKKKMDVKIVRNATGGPDVRARASFNEGTTCKIVLEYGSPLSTDQVVSAVEAAGKTIGLCEWRPERGGDFGTFDVEPLPSDEKTINAILKECAYPEEEFVIPPELLRAFENIPDSHLNDGGRKVKALMKHQAEQKKNSTGETNGASSNTHT